MKKGHLLILCMVVLVTAGVSSGRGYDDHQGPAMDVHLLSSEPEYSILANTWKPLNNPVATEPHGRYGHAMAYDSQNDRVILFSGYGGGPLSDTWAYDVNRAAWTERKPGTYPGARESHAMAYDSQSNRVILFGGYNSTKSDYLGDTWAYDFNSNKWTNMTSDDPEASPPRRMGHAMAYDSKDDRVILFGGYTYYSRHPYLGDTWAYDFNTNTWTDITPIQSSPASRQGHAMVYDSKHDRVILFGGEKKIYYSDTWAFDFNTKKWTNMSPSVSPPGRTYHMMAYDSESDRVILFGGYDGTNYLSDTWVYDFNTNTWTNVTSSTHPDGRYHHAMAYDSESDRVILFGGAPGALSDTWAYDFNTNTWKEMSSTQSGGKCEGHAIAYDSESDRVILFGGYNGNNYLSGTWGYDFNTNAWKEMNPSTHPGGRAYHAMVYDSQNDRVILFGGYDGTNVLSDTWAYDFNTNAWKEMNPSTHPAGRYGHAMAYDSQSKKVILFGGDDGSRLLSDTWAYDFNTNTWKEMNPSTHPAGRYGHAMAYNSLSDRVILFGGYDGSDYISDTWAYDFNTNTWKGMNPGTHPEGRYKHAMAYDSLSDRVILFGGDYGIYLSDTWGYDFARDVWTDMNPGAAPAARSGHAMTYDTRRDLVILFGGYDGMKYFSDTWGYELSSEPFVVDTNPANNSVNVNPSTDIIITFSEVMDKTATEGSISSTPSISGSFSWDSASRVVTWDPSVDLTENTKYTITISKNAKSQGGLNLKAPYIFSFTTGLRDTSPPYVAGTSPSPGAKDVPLDTQITIQWNESMNKGSAEGAFSSTPSITCSWSWNGVNQTCTPSSPLQASTTYKITISTAAKDLAGNAMKSPYSFEFTTVSGGGQPNPNVTDTTPKDGETNVPVNTNIEITFDLEMDTSATEMAISSSPSITGTFSWDSTSKVVTWDPDPDLAPNTKYTITIGTGARSSAGKPLLQPYVFDFTTGSGAGPTPPTVNGTEPSNGAKNVSLDAKISITFSRAMNRTATGGAISASPSISWNASWSSGDTVITLTPSVALEAKTTYTITISTAAKSADGVNLAKKYKFSFTTGADTIPPVIVNTYPKDGETDVPTNITITITFSERMNKDATGGAVTITPGSIISTMWNDDRTLEVAPSLSEGTTYTVRISTNATDLAGNGLASEYKFTFTTKGGKRGDTMMPAGIFIGAVIAVIVVVILFLLLMLRRKKMHRPHPPSSPYPYPPSSPYVPQPYGEVPEENTQGGQPGEGEKQVNPPPPENMEDHQREDTYIPH